MGTRTCTRKDAVIRNAMHLLLRLSTAEAAECLGIARRLLPLNLGRRRVALELIAALPDDPADAALILDKAEELLEVVFGKVLEEDQRVVPLVRSPSASS